jgi:hypothetical protein
MTVLQRLLSSLTYTCNCDTSSARRSWKTELVIVFTRHDVPGNGEHKIMEHIQLSCALMDYNPNISHCLCRVSRCVCSSVILDNHSRTRLYSTTTPQGRALRIRHTSFSFLFFPTVFSFLVIVTFRLFSLLRCNNPCRPSHLIAAPSTRHA